MRAALLAVAIALAAIVSAPAQAVPRQDAAPAERIELRDVQPVRVSKTSDRGELQVTNPNDHWVRFIWGTFRRAKPDGRKRVEASETVTIRVHRHRIDWIALLDGYQLAGQGSVRDIRL
ncbi:hypothetical protein [Nocardioides pyridinolyticus]